MKKFKDLVYDYNDILLAILIIVIAGAVIFWKVSDIMAYPTFAKNQAAKQSQQDVDMTDVDLNPVDVDPIVTPADDVDNEAKPGAENEGGDTQNNTPDNNQQGNSEFIIMRETKFNVPSGYGANKVAKKLEQEKLCKAEDFNAAVTKLGAESKLRAGDFTIPAGSTAEDIVKIIANIQ